MFSGLMCDVHGAWRVIFLGPGVRYSWGLACDIHGAWRAMFMGPDVRCSQGLACDVHRPGVRGSQAWRAMFLGGLECDVHGAWHTMFLGPDVRCSRGLVCDVPGAWRVTISLVPADHHLPHLPLIAALP